MTDNPAWDQLLDEHRTLVMGPLWLKLLEDVVRSVTPRYPPSVYSETGEWNQHARENLVQDVTLPYYAVLSSDGKTVLAKFEGLDSTGGTEFRNFLDFGLEQWKHFRKTQDVAAGSDGTGENRQ